MGDWLDGLARRAARSKDESPNASSGLSRRQLLKRAGVVAGAAWTVPLIQSAVAPAAAASLGYQCLTDGDCNAGFYCVGGYCTSAPKLAWPHETCSGNGTNKCQGAAGAVNCVSGYCPTMPVGGPCRTSTDCNGTPQAGASSPVGCSSGKICGGLGASCSQNSDCVSSNCSGSICAAA